MANSNPGNGILRPETFDPPRRQLDAETVEWAWQTDYYRRKPRKCPANMWTKKSRRFARTLVEPLTSAMQHPRAVTAPSLPRLNTAEAAPLDPALDRRCFTCSAQRQRLKGLARLDENRQVACRGLVSTHDYIDIERVELDAATDSAGLVGDWPFRMPLSSARMRAVTGWRSDTPVGQCERAAAGQTAWSLVH